MSRMPQQKVVLEWNEAQVDYPATTDSKKLKPVIKQFETAKSEQKAVVIFIYTNDMRKSQKSKRLACEKYMDEKLTDPDVAEYLGNCVRLKLNVGRLKDKLLKRAYHLSKITPSLVFFDFTGKYYSRTSSKSIKDITSKLKMLKKKNDRVVKKANK